MKKDFASILFFKSPEIGAIKTRLSPLLPEGILIDLYRLFIKDMYNTLKRYGDVILAVSGNTSEVKSIALTDYSGVLTQRGRDIGERMYNAFIDTFSLGYEKALLTGSDIPDIPGEEIISAKKALERGESALGPSVDGGYYLIAMDSSRLKHKYFENIQWSTPEVFSATYKKITAEGETVHILREWNDIDTPEDLIDFYERNILSKELLSLEYCRKMQEALKPVN